MTTEKKLIELIEKVKAAGFLGGGSLYIYCQYCEVDADHRNPETETKHLPDCLWLELNKPIELKSIERLNLNRLIEPFSPECFGGSDYE